MVLDQIMEHEFGKISTHKEPLKLITFICHMLCFLVPIFLFKFINKSKRSNCKLAQSLNKKNHKTTLVMRRSSDFVFE